MAAIKKRTSKAGKVTYCAEVRIRGVYRSKSFGSKIEAAGWAADQEREIAGGDTNLPKDKTLRDAFTKYGREVSPTKKGAKWEIVRLKKFGRDPIADVMTCNLLPSDVEAWKDRSLMKCKPSSVRREFILMSSVFEAMRRKWKWIKVNPCRQVDRPKSSKHRTRRISPSERDAILGVLGHEEAPPRTVSQQVAIAFLLALETGMRQGEIFAMTKENFDRGGRFIHLPDTKNDESRDVPLSTRAMELMEYVKGLSGERVFSANQASAGSLFLRAVRKAKIKDMTFHDSRHEACTMLAKKIDVLDLAKMIGHKDLKTLMIYYNPTATEIAKRLG